MAAKKTSDAVDPAKAERERKALLIEQDGWISTAVHGYYTKPDVPVTHTISVVTRKDEDGHEVEVLHSKYAYGFWLDLKKRIAVDGVITHLVVTKVTLNNGSHEIELPVTGITGPNSTMGRTVEALGEALTRPEMQKLNEWIVRATRTDVQTDTCVERPYLNADQARIPGIHGVKARPGRNNYGPDRDGDEEAARPRLQEAYLAAANHPKLALVAGAVNISFELERIETPGSVFHPYGDSTLGKTQDMESSMRQMGTNPELRGEWMDTLNGTIDRLAEASIMPYGVDETATGRRDEMAILPFNVRNGREKIRANDKGKAREAKTFRLNVLSTGEMRLTQAIALSGLRRRVIELKAPLADKETADLFAEVMGEHPGWTLKLLVDLGPATKEDLQAVLDRAPEFEDSMMQEQVRVVSAAILGFERACRAVGLEEVPEVDWSVVWDELGEAMQDEGRTWQRLMRALREHLDTWSGRYEANDLGGLGFSPDQRYGKDLGKTWGVMPKTAERIAAEIGIEDVKPVMQTLAEKDILVPGEGRNLQKKVTIGKGKQTRMYVLRKIDNEDENASDTMSDVGAGTDVSALYESFVGEPVEV